MATILQSSGFVLGKQFPGVGRAGDHVRKALKDSLESAVSKGLESGIDLFLVAGNLFATNLVSRHLVDFVYSQVERLGRIPFVVVPGVCDSLEENSVYHHLHADNRPDNLFIINDLDKPFLNIHDSEITVYGMPYCPGMDQERFFSIERQDFVGSHIVVLTTPFEGEEGKISETYLSRLAALPTKGFSYVAIGNSSSFKKWNDNAYSSGAPEMIDYDLQDSGQVILVNLTDAAISVEKLVTRHLNWSRLRLESDKFKYNIEIEREIQKFEDPQTLLSCSIEGDFEGDGFLDLPLLERNQQQRFLRLSLDDNRVLDTKRNETGANPAGSLVSEYVNLLEEAIEKAPMDVKATYQKALYNGAALLSGKDVIS